MRKAAGQAGHRAHRFGRGRCHRSAGRLRVHPWALRTTGADRRKPRDRPARCGSQAPGGHAEGLWGLKMRAESMRGRPDACARACRGAKVRVTRPEGWTARGAAALGSKSIFWHFEASVDRSKTCGRAARGRCWRATNLVPPLPVDSASSEAGATGPQRKGTGRRVAVGVRASRPRAGL